jgi:hypothetical protein
MPAHRMNTRMIKAARSDLLEVLDDRRGQPCTSCSMRARRTGKPQLWARPICYHGHGVAVTRGNCGRVDL